MITDDFFTAWPQGSEAIGLGSRQISKRTPLLPSMVKIATTLRDLL
jgi:hypothetical protein